MIKSYNLLDEGLSEHLALYGVSEEPEVKRATLTESKKIKEKICEGCGRPVSECVCESNKNVSCDPQTGDCKKIKNKKDKIITEMEGTVEPREAAIKELMKMLKNISLDVKYNNYSFQRILDKYNQNRQLQNLATRISIDAGDLQNMIKDVFFASAPKNKENNSKNQDKVNSKQEVPTPQKQQVVGNNVKPSNVKESISFNRKKKLTEAEDSSKFVSTKDSYEEREDQERAYLANSENGSKLDKLRNTPFKDWSKEDKKNYRPGQKKDKGKIFSRQWEKDEENGIHKQADEKERAFRQRSQELIDDTNRIGGNIFNNGTVNWGAQTRVDTVSRGGMLPSGEETFEHGSVPRSSIVKTTTIDKSSRKLQRPDTILDPSEQVVAVKKFTPEEKRAYGQTQHMNKDKIKKLMDKRKNESCNEGKQFKPQNFGKLLLTDEPDHVDDWASMGYDDASDETRISNRDLLDMSKNYSNQDDEMNYSNDKYDYLNSEHDYAIDDIDGDDDLYGSFGGNDGYDFDYNPDDM